MRGSAHAYSCSALRLWASASPAARLPAGHHKGLKLSEEDKVRIAAELGAGKAGVGVLARIEDGAMIQERLTGVGGAASTTMWSTKRPSRLLRRNRRRRSLHPRR